MLAAVSVRAGPWRRADAPCPRKEKAGTTGSWRVSERLKKQQNRRQFGALTNSRHCVRALGRFPFFVSKRGRNRRFVRRQFARDARRQHDAVARRRRGWRSIAHTASLSDFANRRHVWSPDAARLASIVCRQPPETSCRDHSNGRGTALSSTADLGGAGSPKRGWQRGLLIGCPKEAKMAPQCLEKAVGRLLIVML